MDKKGVLINRLQEQYQQGANETALLNTALLLVTELQYQQASEPAAAPGKVSVIMPVKHFEVISNADSFSEENIKKQEATSIQEEQPLIRDLEETSIQEKQPEPAADETPGKTEEVSGVQENQPEPAVDETLNEVMENNILPESFIEPEAKEQADYMPAPEPETEPVQPSAINTLAEEKYNDVIDEIPTLAQQQPKVVYELNQSLQSEEPSINDRLKQAQTEAGSRLQTEPIKDLRKAIGINDKYVFIRELFRNDEAAYERSLKTINGFNMLPEAEYWIQREMKYKLGWDDNNPTVKAFYQLVRRRFS